MKSLVIVRRFLVVRFSRMLAQLPPVSRVAHSIDAPSVYTRSRTSMLPRSYGRGYGGEEELWRARARQVPMGFDGRCLGRRRRCALPRERREPLRHGPRARRRRGHHAEIRVRGTERRVALHLKHNASSGRARRPRNALRRFQLGYALRIEIAAMRARMGRRRASRGRSLARERREGADLAAHGYDRAALVVHGESRSPGVAFREEGLCSSHEGPADGRADDAVVHRRRPAPRYCLGNVASVRGIQSSGSPAVRRPSKRGGMFGARANALRLSSTSPKCGCRRPIIGWRGFNRRSSTRGMPRGLFGKVNLMARLNHVQTYAFDRQNQTTGISEIAPLPDMLGTCQNRRE